MERGLSKTQGNISNTFIYFIVFARWFVVGEGQGAHYTRTHLVVQFDERVVSRLPRAKGSLGNIQKFKNRFWVHKITVLRSKTLLNLLVHHHSTEKVAGPKYSRGKKNFTRARGARKVIKVKSDNIGNFAILQNSSFLAPLARVKFYFSLEYFGPATFSVE